MTNPPVPTSDDAIIEHLRTELAKATPSRRRRIIEKFFLAALGSIPWVGGFLSAAANYKTEEAGIKLDSLQTQWLEEHQARILALYATLRDIEGRFGTLGIRLTRASRARST